MSDDSDDDLGRELLQAVGHAGSKKGGGGGAAAGRQRPRKPNKSRRRSSDEEGESSEEEESEERGSEDEEDEEEWGDRGEGKGKDKDDDGFSGSKAKSSIMPFKKRFDTGMVPEAPQSASRGERERKEDEEEEDGRRGADEGRADSDDSGSELSFGSEGDLYKDDEDRERLEAMNELMREEILYERGERRDRHNERKRIRERMRRERQAKKEAEELRRTPSRQKKSEAEVTPMSWRRGSLAHKSKDVALQKLEAAKAKKEQKRQDSSQKRRREEEEEEEEDEEEDDRARKRRDKRRDYDDRRVESEEEYEEDEEEEEEEDEEDEEEEDERDLRRRGRDDDSEDEGRRGRLDEDDLRRREDDELDEEDDEERAKEEQADVEDLQHIMLPRSRLSQWCMEPFFEKVVTGSYVRLGIGVNKQGENVYRVCEVVGVDDRDPSKQYKLDNRMICKFLDCRWGEHRARWQMARVSDKPPTKEEVLQLFRQVDRAPGLRRLSKKDVARKVADMEEARSFVYTPAVVRGMVEQKRQASGRPTNLLYERDRLRIAIAKATDDMDEPEVHRLQQELMRIEKLEEERLGALQKATQKETLAMMNKRNRTENFKNASIGGKAAMEMSQADSDLNPFSRRWTRIQNYYKPVEAKAEPARGAPAEGAKEEEEKKAPGPQDVPLQSLPSLRSHDFELSIDLNLLASWGGAGGWPDAFMARKQRQERVYGAPTACQDGRRHTQTLSINDYKRRRSIL